MNNALAFALVLIVSAIPAIAADAPDGAALYKSKCASCHGKDGKGNEKLAKPMKVEAAALSFEGKTATDEEFTKVTADGRKKMPAFGKKLSPEEIKAVVVFARGLVPKVDKKDDKKDVKKDAK